LRTRPWDTNPLEDGNVGAATGGQVHPDLEGEGGWEAAGPCFPVKVETARATMALIRPGPSRPPHGQGHRGLHTTRAIAASTRQGPSQPPHGQGHRGLHTARAIAAITRPGPPRPPHGQGHRGLHTARATAASTRPGPPRLPHSQGHRGHHTARDSRPTKPGRGRTVWCWPSLCDQDGPTEQIVPSFPGHSAAGGE
jgi:hypothetical protein